jgi:hypothetical protein
MHGTPGLLLTMLSSLHARQQAPRVPRTRRDSRGAAAPYPWDADDARHRNGG